MGGSNSKIKQLNETLNKTTMEVMSSASSSSGGAINANQSISAFGNAKMHGVNITQIASISLSSLQKSSVNAAMQADLVSKLEAKINEEASNFPQITAANSSSDIHNKVKNVVESRLDVESITSMMLELEANQKVSGYDDAEMADINAYQELKGIGSMVNDMTTDLTSQLTADTSMSADTTKKTTFFVADMIDSAMNGFTNMLDTLGLDPTTIFLLVVAVIVAGIVAVKLGGGYLATKEGAENADAAFAAASATT